MDDKSILVGAMNNVYNLSLAELNENRESRVEWSSLKAHVEMCKLKGKNDTDCQNYIRIFVRMNDGQFMLCGTNSFKPTCRYYKVDPIKGDSEMLQEFEGEGRLTSEKLFIYSRKLTI
jgi:semaphorin 6